MREGNEHAQNTRLRESNKWRRPLEYFNLALVVLQSGTPPSHIRDGMCKLADYSYRDGLLDGVLCSIRTIELVLKNDKIDLKYTAGAIETILRDDRLNAIGHVILISSHHQDEATSSGSEHSEMCNRALASIRALVSIGNVSDSEQASMLERIQAVLPRLAPSECSVVLWWAELDIRHVQLHVSDEVEPGAVQCRVPFDKTNRDHRDQMLAGERNRDAIYASCLETLLTRLTMERNKNGFMQAMVCGGSFGPGNARMPELKRILKVAKEVATKLANNGSTRDLIRGVQALKICYVHSSDNATDGNIDAFLRGDFDVIIGWNKFQVGFDTPPTKFLLNLREFDKRGELSDPRNSLLQLYGRVLRRPSTSRGTLCDLALKQGGEPCLEKTKRYSESCHPNVEAINFTADHTVLDPIIPNRTVKPILCMP